ncbi:MAG: type II toxin-antitoxin system HipA family toxin [Bacteroidaceae bacterium]|nr:type II toxin-antitoxin system HipA family toxin [Bacteroidaceae bacterium]
MDELIVDVRLWGQLVGSLYWDSDKEAAVFEYERGFLRNGWEVSPLVMPLSKGQSPQQFLQNRNKCFSGLPGMVADSLPDAFGNQIINEWFVSKGLPMQEITPLDRLCYVGKRAMGALEFEPSRHVEGLDESSIVYLHELTALAESVFAERTDFQDKLQQSDKSVIDILKVGTSAGGAKPKAIIAYNDETGEVRSGQVEAPEGFGYWLLKFDGGRYAEHSQLSDNPRGIGNIEYAYYLMAKECGIRMSECRLLSDGEQSHFMTRRFDRTAKGDKLHMQTLAGLAHLDRDQRHSYEQIFEILRKMKFGMPEREQIYRRMVFNVVMRNHDDHTKNFSFLMDRRGKWSLAPAYDLCYSYSPNGRWTSRHQLSLNGKQDGFERKDLLDVARNVGINGAEQIIEQIVHVASLWEQYADEAGVPVSFVRSIQKELLLL